MEILCRKYAERKKEKIFRPWNSNQNPYGARILKRAPCFSLLIYFLTKYDEPIRYILLLKQNKYIFFYFQVPVSFCLFVCLFFVFYTWNIQNGKTCHIHRRPPAMMMMMEFSSLERKPATQIRYKKKKTKQKINEWTVVLFWHICTQASSFHSIENRNTYERIARIFWRKVFYLFVSTKSSLKHLFIDSKMSMKTLFPSGL